MIDNNSNDFLTTLETERHTHMGLNGNKEFLFSRTGKMINPLYNVLESMDEMHRWVSSNIDDTFHGIDGEKILIDACFHQAESME